MGNSSSSSRRSSFANTETASRAAEQASDSGPIVCDEAKVNQVFEAMKDAFNRTTQKLTDVEKELLLSKLCSKFQEEYPSELMAATTIMEESVGVASSPVPRKKRKLSKDTRIIIQKWAIPLEVLLNVARFLPRKCLNNLKSTCKRVHHAILNPELLTQPWGTKCPFQFPFPLGCVIFSGDGSLVAVFTKGSNGPVDEDGEEEGAPGILQIWDRRKGLIGELECAHWMRFKPVFSPDNQLLLLCPRNNQGGIRVCMLPSGEQQVPMVVSFHYLYGAFVVSAAFFDSTTMAFMVEDENGVKTCNVTCDNDQISFTEPDQTTLVDPDHYGVDGQGWCGSLASFSSASKDIVAFVYDQDDRTIILHDRRTNASVVKPIPAVSSDVYDLAFSRDGNRLVAAHREGGLSVFDCNVDTIEEIGEPRVISLKGTHFGSISFSPGSASMIAVSYWRRADQVTKICTIDIENEQILCDRWNHSSWKSLVR